MKNRVRNKVPIIPFYSISTMHTFPAKLTLSMEIVIDSVNQKGAHVKNLLIGIQ